MLWLIPGLPLGFAAGLLAFKVKSRWCPRCGTSTITLIERQQTAR